MKNRRISGCLYEIRVHPIQSLQGSHSSGMMNKSSSFLSKSSSTCSSSYESFLPGICKEIISSALDFLGHGHANEQSVADSIIMDLITVHTGVAAISSAYESQDDESLENFFSSDRDTQFHSIRMTSAFEQLVILTKHWLDRFQQFAESPKIDELQYDLKKLGGYLQLLLQGCCSDISSMVREARDRALQTIEQAIKRVGHIAASTGTELHLTEEINSPKKSFIHAIYEGIASGLHSLVDITTNKAKDTEEELLGNFSHSEALKETKNIAVRLVIFLQKPLKEYKKVDIEAQLKEQDAGCHDLKKIASLGEELLKLSHSVAQFCRICVSFLKGTDGHGYRLVDCLDNISSSTQLIKKYFSLFRLSPDTLRSKIHTSFWETSELNDFIKSMIKSVHPERDSNVFKSECSYVQRKTKGELSGTDVALRTYEKKGVSKIVFQLNPQTVTSMEFSPSAIQWV